MNFANVKKLTIPQGEVAYIYQGNNLFWRRHSTPTAVLYNDGSMVFYADSSKIDTSKTILGRYTGWDTDVYITTDAAVATTPWMGVATQIKSVSFVGAVAPISTAYWFFGCTNLTSIDLTNLYTNKLVYMAAMFYNCSSLVTLDLSMLDTSNLLNCNSMFAYCRKLTTIYVSELWDTSKLVDSGYMFYECTSLIGGYHNTYTSTEIDKDKAHFLIDGYLTYKATPKWKAPIAVLYEDGSFVFYENDSFEDSSKQVVQKFTGWHIEDIRATSLIPWADYYKQIRSIDFVGRIKAYSTNYWFYGFSNLVSVKNINNLDLGNALTMGGMFQGCSSLAQLDLSGLDTSNIREMDRMFASCQKLTTIYVSSSWTTKSVTNSNSMFQNCYALKGDIPFNSNYTDATYATTTGGYLTLKT